MPRDDWARAKAKGIGRAERMRLDREIDQLKRENLYAKFNRDSVNERFPKHELIKQLDGSLRSPEYQFHVDRWK